MYRFVAFSVFSLALALPRAADANLVARWAFDDLGGTTASDSIADHDGTLHGSAAFVPSGIRGGALSTTVAGNGYVDMGDIFQFLGFERFSVQIWVRTEQATGALLVGRHVSTVVQGWWVGLNDTNDGPPNEPAGSFHLYQSDVPDFQSGDQGINDGEWHQLVAVRDSSSANQIRLYVDGERVPSPTSSGGIHSIVPTTAPFLVAAAIFSGQPQGTYDGDIDELRIWDNALSDDEVRFFYDHPDSQNAVLCGDANSTSSISATDAQLALRTSVGTASCLDCVCDVNGIGGVTATDALAILKVSVQLHVPFSCPLCIAGDLAKLRWEIPCGGDLSATVCSSQNFFSDSAKFLGTPGTTYDVTLRFRGVVEQKTYVGGTQDGLFYTGGAPDGGPYNIYRLTVSNPSSVYYLNAGTSGIERVWLLDVTKTIPIAADATVVLDAEAIDNAEISNQDGSGQPIIPAGVPPAPDAFDGQFIQMDVVSVVKQAP